MISHYWNFLRGIVFAFANIAAACITASALAEPAISDAHFDTLGMELSEPEKIAITHAMEYGRMISSYAKDQNGLPYRRDAHAKATGCVRATFSINGNIPNHLQHGVFAFPSREYQAWIRFSNGDMLVQPDKTRDARGMAIKLINVDGEKIAPELPGAATQDFIMTNLPVFFNRNIFDYTDNMRFLAEQKRLAWFINLWPPRFHPKQLYIAAQTVSSRIPSPLQPQYYSMLPYQLGTTALKFSAKPCAKLKQSTHARNSDRDYLTEVMAEHLNTQAACFDFMLQEQRPGQNMPIDDATVEWSEKESPFVAVAKVHIPPQSFTSPEQQAFCENLSMNPWHGTKGWLPLGSLSKARRLVYRAVSQFRHQQNKVIASEPTSWCLHNSETCNLADIFHVLPPPRPPAVCFDSMYTPLDGSNSPRCEL